MLAPQIAATTSVPGCGHRAPVNGNRGSAEGSLHTKSPTPQNSDSGIER